MALWFTGGTGTGTDRTLLVDAAIATFSTPDLTASFERPEIVATFEIPTVTATATVTVTMADFEQSSIEGVFYE
jgi:hypothetical protein